MSDVALPGSIEPARRSGPDLEKGFHPLTGIIYLGVIGAALLFVAYSIYADVGATGAGKTSYAAFLLLFVALLISLGFEFVNGFHDTANAVATVIYTRSMPAHVAVVWSGLFNLIGVLLSSGAVAFGIVSLLPVELILQVGSSAGFAMVFALLIAAIIWNVGTWYFGLPASSSHTLIGSIMGVGIANALMHGREGTSGVDWSQAVNTGKALLLSPLFGFLLAAILLYGLKTALLRATPALFGEPQGDQPPPWWIRGILILTCTLVSFFHGSNDGQKGMGLIMLILIGVVPTAYALNRAMPASQIAAFTANSAAASKVVEDRGADRKVTGDPRPALTNYISLRQLTDDTYPSLAVLIGEISDQVVQYGSLAKFPAETVRNTRNDMYLVSEALRLLMKGGDSALSDADAATLNRYKGSLDAATKFIPSWVKIAVAIALGLGTMVGWKRIVVTVGEKIGKTHLTYAQGACAEITAAATIAAADGYGLPVSTTHVLSSGIAGTMTANGSGLQWSTIRNIAMAWVLTLPVAMLISGVLYFVFAHLFQPEPQTTGRILRLVRGKEFRVADASFSLLTGNSIETRLVRAGGIIFREGEQANELFVIKSGYVRIQVGNKTMADLAPDTIFGEMALIDNEPRSATATALTDVELVPVSEKQFLFLVSQTPHFALKVMRTLAQRLRTMNKGVY